MDNKKLNNNKELSARLMAVQAYYQNLQNKKPIREVIEQYINSGIEADMGNGEEQELVKPHGELFKKILLNLDNRSTEIADILAANINKKEVPIVVVAEENAGKNEEKNEEPATPSLPPEKEMEALLKSILLCGVSEILSHQDIDTAIIIDDYLNVTHAFYEKQQVSFVNGVLDKIASLIRP